MKKVKGVVLALFMILLLNCQSLYAKENYKTVIVTEENIRIQFPESCYVLQQEVDEEDPYLSLIGARKEDVEEYYKANNIFVHAVAGDQSYEIVCTVKPNENQQYLKDLSIISDSEIKNLSKNMAAAYEQYGYTNISSDIFTTDNMKFALINFTTSNNEETVHCKQYYTVLNDKAYYFTLRVFGETIDNDIVYTMWDVVNSIYLFKSAEVSQIKYENKLYGVSFEIPDGWEKVDSSNSNEFLQVQFVHANRMGETFQLYVYDVWSNLDIVRKIINTRNSLETNNSETDFSGYEKYIQGFYNDGARLKKGSFGKTKLIYEEKPFLIEHDDIQGNYYRNTYCMLRLGILYVFQYGYYEGSDIHSEEIKNILDSISLQEPEVLLQDTERYEEISNFTYAVLAICFTVMVALGVVIYLYIKSKKNIESNQDNSI